MKKTTYSAVALVGMATLFSAAAAAVNQDRIPELQRDGWRDGQGATITGCVARGAATDTYILTSIAKDGEITSKDAVPRAPIVLSSKDIDMGKHIGHSVSVTGSYEREWPSAFATTEESASVGVIGNSSKKTSRTFTVKSLIMIADSCSQPAE